MSQKNIDFGEFPDDPNSDAIRTAFQKVQENFTELFTAQEAQGVQSINRTSQPGITVNSTTGNVLISANISQVQFRTTSLALGISAPGTATEANITSSSQVLYVDIAANTIVPTSLTVGTTAPNTVIGSGNITTSANITAGNVNAGNLLAANFIAGNLTTAAQPNITSVDPLKLNSFVSNILPAFESARDLKSILVSYFQSEELEEIARNGSVVFLFFHKAFCAKTASPASRKLVKPVSPSALTSSGRPSSTANFADLELLIE